MDSNILMKKRNMGKKTEIIKFLSGYLRSVDQFANLVLHQTIERIHVGKCYGDIPRGVFVVRGENVVLLGEIDAEKTEPKDIGLTEVSLEEILEKQVN